jgi:aryl-alcohol dehydrogenase-like predicted oxidoreductase
MHILQRLLGSSGIQVSAMGLGCWAIGGPFWRGETPAGWGNVDDEESIRAIHRALDLGITFFDTADVYGAGHSERVLGRALKGVRKETVIATKFGNIFDESTRQITGASATAEHIRQACDASLRRLDTDYIDLYQFHNGGYPLEDAEAVREVLEELVSNGKIRTYGWSTDDPERARLFAAGAHCSAVQHQMNVLSDAGAMIALCEELGLASINRGPLAMGLLTGKYQSDSKLAADDVRGENAPNWMQFFKNGKPNPEWLTRLEAIRDVLRTGGRTLAQGALAWIWGRSDRTIPIPGFKTVAQVEENCNAVRFGPLTPQEMGQIDRLLRRS